MKKLFAPRAILTAAPFAINLFFCLCLELSAREGNIMLGILFIAFYRLSLWAAPFALTVICWLPLRPKITAKEKLLNNTLCLALSFGLFVLCKLVFGSWY
jgi:hypothetical protein